MNNIGAYRIEDSFGLDTVFVAVGLILRDGGNAVHSPVLGMSASCYVLEESIKLRYKFHRSFLKGAWWPADVQPDRSHLGFDEISIVELPIHPEFGFDFSRCMPRNAEGSFNTTLSDVAEDAAAFCRANPGPYGPGR